MRRLIVVLLVSGLSLALPPRPSRAGPSDGCVEDLLSSDVVCTVSDNGRPTIVPGGTGGGGPAVVAPGPADILWWPVLVWEPEAGRTCVVFRREVFAGAAASQRAQEAEARALALLGTWRLCTTSPTPALALPFLARDYIERVGLPTPQPRLAPGYGLTGQPAYLETRSTLHPEPFEAPTPVGPISVRASGAYLVDWGDGSPAETHTVEGRPWPEGSIRHVYTATGTYTITVTATWTAQWTAATASGTATGITTTARIEDFEVRQVQAVRRR